MAGYTFDLALVKYYRESLDEYATFMPFKITNTKDQAFYAKISIINQGNLLWYFNDNAGNLVTEKVYTINANSVLSLNEKLVASATPTETQKDQVQIKIQYYKDAELTQLFGEDNIIVNIHCYIQNSDYSWSSTYYTEDQIVFDKFNFAGINKSISTGEILQGVNGNAKMYGTRYEGNNTTIYTEYSPSYLESTLDLYLKDYLLQNVTIDNVDDTPLDSKFMAVFLTFVQASGYFKAGYSPSRKFDFYRHGQLIITTSKTTQKVIFYPMQNYHYTLHFGRGHNNSMHARLDGLVIFNPLP